MHFYAFSCPDFSQALCLSILIFTRFPYLITIIIAVHNIVIICYQDNDDDEFKKEHQGWFQFHPHWTSEDSLFPWRPFKVNSFIWIIFQSNSHCVWSTPYINSFRTNFIQSVYSVQFRGPDIRKTYQVQDLSLNDKWLKMMNMVHTGCFVCSPPKWRKVSWINRYGLLIEPP